MEFKFRLLLPFCILFSIQCNTPSVNAMIGENVREADVLEILYVVSFLENYPPYTNPLESHFCTGTLISRQHVLSSARCITYYRHNETVVLAGTTNLTYGVFYYITWWINFAEWSNYRHRNTFLSINDISISKLDRLIEDYIPHISILPLHSERLPGRNGMMIGWGVGNNGQQLERLLIGEVTIHTREQCARRISRLEQRRLSVDSRVLCSASNPFTLLQEGDFGGPLIVGNYLVGINKETRPFTNEIFHPEKVNVHVNVDFYRTFILTATSDEFYWITSF